MTPKLAGDVRLKAGINKVHVVEDVEEVSLDTE